MKNIITVLLILVIIPFVSTAQNKFQLSFSVAQGNTSWKYNNLKIAETDFEGDTLNVYDINTHATSPTILATLKGGYSFNKLTTGIDITVQHYFTDIFITDPIYFEASEFYFPISFSQYNDPQPTHFKISPYVEYALIKGDKFELFTSVAGGSFLTRSMATDSLEGFHWFINLSAGLNYIMNDKLTFSFFPAFDYSRLNFAFLDKSNPYLNIYSFYTSFGIKYNLVNNKD
ncbi:MAG: hypothetical protein ACKVPJ_07260 [Chitinophagales bacterium]